MAFIKAADNRKSASFAVRPGRKSANSEEAEENPYCEYKPYYMYTSDEEPYDENTENTDMPETEDYGEGLTEADFEDLPQYFNPYDAFIDDDDDDEVLERPSALQQDLIPEASEEMRPRVPLGLPTFR